MKRLDRYIFRQGAVPFVLILLCTTVVIWLTQVLQRVDLMVDDGSTLATFLAVTALLIPNLMGVILPFALFAAVLYALNLMAVDSELPVMKSAGASRMRIARPLILLSLIAELAVLAINVDLQPRSYRVLKETVADVRSDIARTFIRSKVFSEVIPGITVYAEEVRPGDQYIGLLIHDSRDPNEVTTYTAERGLFQLSSNGPKLLLVQGTAQRPDAETGNIEILRFVETAVDLTAFQPEGRQRNLEGTERYVSELLYPDMSNPYDVERAGQLIAEGHSRFATSLYAPAFTFIALAVMLTAPVSRRGYGSALVKAIAFAVGLRTLGYVAQAQSASAPSVWFNLSQYLVPSIAIFVSIFVLTGGLSARKIPKSILRERHIRKQKLVLGT